MSVSLDVAVSELRRAPLADPKLHLKPGGRQELAAEIERWSANGLRAHVLVVDPGDPLSELLQAWEPLGLNEQRDLLLIFDTQRWVARGWGIEQAEIQRALAEAWPRGHSVYSQQLIGGLRALSRLASSSGGDAGVSAFGIVGGVGVLAVGGVLALAIRRRNLLAKLGAAKLAEAQSSAERTYTELILACEELPEPEQASELQLRAAELKRRLDGVVEEVRQRPATGNDPVRIGELRQLENELAALRSTMLQKMPGSGR